MNQEKQNKEEKIDNFLGGDKQENKEEKDQKPKCSCGSKLGVVLAIVLTTILIGGGVYYFLNQQHRSESEKLTTQIESERKIREECEMEKGEISSKKQEAKQEVDLGKIVESDVSTWKTYQNKELGYNFKYPSDLTLRGMSSGNGDGPLPQTGVFLQHKQIRGSSFLYVYEPSTNDISHNPKAKTLDDYKKDYFVDSVRKVVVISQEEIVLPSGKALKQKYSAGDAKEKLAQKDFSSEYWNGPYTFDNYELYRLSFGYEDNAIRYVVPSSQNNFIILKTWKDEENYEKLLDKIANSFQFDDK